MKKKIWMIAGCAALILILIIAGLWISKESQVIFSRTEAEAVDCVQDALDAHHWVHIPQENIVAEAELSQLRIEGQKAVVQNGTVAVAAGQAVTVPVDVPADGSYALALTYQTLGNTIVQATVTVTLGQTNVKSYINGVWCDESKAYILDRYHNEVTPSQTKVDAFVTDYIRDCTILNLDPVSFTLTAGQQIITIENNDQDILLSGIYLTRMPKSITYEEYAKDYDGSSPTQPIIIEGENYIAKSDSYVRTKADINSSCVPYSSFQKLLNAIDYYSWQTAGQRVVWEFEAAEAGWYNIALHYTQSEKEGQSVYRDIEIDGQIPYRELKEVGFGYTGSSYKNAVLNVNGKTAKIYLTAGTHTISLYTNVPSMAPIVEEINAISAELSAIGLNLQQVAGSNADVNRTWDIETYIPGVTEHMRTLQQRLLDAYDELSRLSGTAASSCANLKQAAGIIQQAL